MRNRTGNSLSLHPRRPGSSSRTLRGGTRKRHGLGKPETFNFLGFTLICGRPRAGKFQLRRKSRRDRMQAKLRMIKDELRLRMHQPIPSRDNG